MAITNSREQERLEQNLQKYNELCVRMRLVRMVFEDRLSQNPEKTWAPTLKNLANQKVVGYSAQMVGTFRTDRYRDETPIGEYMLNCYAGKYEDYWEMSTALTDCRIEVGGWMTGAGSVLMTLVPECEIRRMGENELMTLQARLMEAENILGRLGFLPTEG